MAGVLRGSGPLSCSPPVLCPWHSLALSEVLDRLERACVEQAFTLWTGYAAFCEESVGVAAEKVGAVVLEPVMERIADLKVRAERLGVKADEALVEEMQEGLAESWRVVEERGV